MRFQVEIDGASACARPSLLKGEHLSVLHAVKCIEAFANDLPSAICNDRTNASSRRGKTAASPREIQRLVHEMFVLFRKCHDLHDGR
jgi:hypothetical protein